jgi:hypothetical protein
MTARQSAVTRTCRKQTEQPLGHAVNIANPLLQTGQPRREWRGASVSSTWWRRITATGGCTPPRGHPVYGSLSATDNESSVEPEPASVDSGSTPRSPIRLVVAHPRLLLHSEALASSQHPRSHSRHSYWHAPQSVLLHAVVGYSTHASDGDRLTLEESAWSLIITLPAPNMPSTSPGGGGRRKLRVVA